MTAENKALGCCACEAIKFVIDLPVKFCVHCHCSACRQAHGAAFVTWLGVLLESFKLTGREHLKWFRCSKRARRGFCSNCGTPLFFTSTRWPGEIHVTRASLVSKVEITPQCHVFFDQHAPWFSVEDSLPHLGGPQGMTPLD